MKWAVLVGAGATLAEARPSQPSLSKQPPLDTTFFDLCRRIKFPHLASVKRYMISEYGLDPLSGNYRMEEVFNFLYTGAFSSEPPKGCLQAYWALLRMYASAIAQTTNGLAGTSHFGVGALLRAIWRSDDSPDIVFVTFNQDLVIEKAVQRATETQRYSGIPWNIQLAYSNAFADYSRFAQRSRPFSSDGETSIKVLKLHGSLNWVYSVRSDTDPKNSIRHPSGDLLCINEEVVYQGLRHKPGQKIVHLLPLIVPPVYEKASRYQETLGPLWVSAFDEISRANRLLIFGYSFPDTDFTARSLLTRAYYRNRDLTEITVVDTNPAVAAKISSLLGVDSMHHFLSVPAVKSSGILHR